LDHFTVTPCHAAAFTRIVACGPRPPPGAAPLPPRTKPLFTLFATQAFRGRPIYSSATFDVAEAAAPYLQDGLRRYGRCVVFLDIASRSKVAPVGASKSMQGPGPRIQLAVMQMLRPCPRPVASGPTGQQPAMRTRWRAAAAAAAYSEPVDTRLVSDIFRYTAAPLLPDGLEVIRVNAVYAVAVMQPVPHTLPPRASPALGGNLEGAGDEDPSSGGPASAAIAGAGAVRRRETVMQRDVRCFWERMGGDAAWRLSVADWYRLAAPQSDVD